MLLARVILKFHYFGDEAHIDLNILKGLPIFGDSELRGYLTWLSWRIVGALMWLVGIDLRGLLFRDVDLFVAEGGFEFLDADLEFVAALLWRSKSRILRGR